MTSGQAYATRQIKYNMEGFMGAADQEEDC